MKNVVLIGFMATGKTTVGRRLAARLGLDFVDTDAEIERITGKTVQEIFSCYGVVRFRSEESLAIKKLAGEKGRVIATGGGVVLDPENITELRRNGVLIRLVAAPEVIVSRVDRKRDRPLLNQSDVRGTVEKLMREREDFYRRAADYTVDTSSLNKEEAVEQIIFYLRERKLFNG
ncbi:MAG: shikimate kinase [Peptococcaceae bacterium BRH_c4b]|nr:MAG: shikimate kinase [Peptococcaceae bacterium BRH_c4b]